MVYLLPFLSYLAGPKSVSTRSYCFVEFERQKWETDIGAVIDYTKRSPVELLRDIAFKDDDLFER